MIEFLFWLTLLLLLHSYVLFPILLKWFVQGKSLPTLQGNTAKQNIYVVLSVYNGEALVERLLDSILRSVIAPHNVFVLVGSDASSDSTNSILRQYSILNPNVALHEFTERRGKTLVVNDLINLVPQDAILVMTDVSAEFDPDCIRVLINRLQSSIDIGIVGANIIKGNHSKDGISYQEKVHYEREVEMKFAEGVLWGVSIGLFGACYAIRKSDVTPIPTNFVVDDFFMTMQVIEKGKKALLDTNAKIFMELPNKSRHEFRRKIRISVGNYQNLMRFWKMLFHFNTTSFAFWSHRALRWVGPFFIITIIFTNLFLAQTSTFYQSIWYVQLCCLTLPFINFLLAKCNIHNKYIRFISHFYTTNAAFLVGFLRFISGNTSTVWQPTKR